jgi:hypothetical protein
MHHLATFAFLLAAIACYVAGATLAVMTLLAVGMGFEAVFWMRLIKRRRARFSVAS